MSMMACRRCDQLVDTDYDMDGIWLDTGYICESCTDKMNDEERAELEARS
jgi:hypothetical protein